MSDGELPPTNPATSPPEGASITVSQPAVGPIAPLAGDGSGTDPTEESAAASPAPTPAPAAGEANPDATNKGAIPKVEEKPPTAESQPTSAEIAMLWAGQEGAYGMVREYAETHKSEYNTDAKARRIFAKAKKLDANKPDDLAQIDAEMARRKRVLDALETVKIALEVAQKKRTDWKKGATDGSYQITTDDGTTVVREVWMHLAYEPILEEVKKLATETESKEGTEKPTKRAEQAKKILDVLEPRLVPVTLPDGIRKGFRIEPDLNKIEIKKAQESSYTYALHLIDAVLEPFGQKLEYGENDKKTKRKRLKLDVLSKIDPTCRTGEFGELGSRLTRLAVLLDQYETVDAKEYPDAKAYLAAMIYDEASQIDISRITSGNHPNLADELKGLKEHEAILHQYRDDLLVKVKTKIYQYYYPGQELNPEKLNKIPLTETNLFRDLFFAYACEGHVGYNEKNELVMEESFKSEFDKARTRGEVFSSDLDAILFLAGSKQAGTILKNELGFNPDTLKERKIKYYADRVIKGIDAKRPDDKKMTTTERENYYKVFEEIQALGEEAGQGSKLGGWIKALGILALILGPSVFKMFEEGTETGQGQQTSPG